MKILNAEGAELTEIPESRCKSYGGVISVNDVNLSSANLRNGVLSNLIFTLGDFDGALFEGSSLRNVNFQGSIMFDVDMRRVFIEGSVFYGIQGYGAKFQNSTLRNVRFHGSSVQGADFSDSTMEGVVIGKDNINHLSDISGADFSNVDLNGVRFEGAKYDDFTQFPDAFDPSSYAGLLKS
jgi:uncharacterized protein YjbI with pentapeptide repeats